MADRDAARLRAAVGLAAEPVFAKSYTWGRRVNYLVLCWGVLFNRSIKTVLPEDGNLPGALVWTKLVTSRIKEKI